MLANNRLHPTQMAQYRIDLLNIQRAHGYSPVPGAAQPLAFINADLALDARYLAESARLFGIDQQHAAAVATAQPAAAPAQPRVQPQPALPLAPNHRFGLWLMGFVVILVAVGLYLHSPSAPTTTTTQPALTKAEVEAMIAASKPQTSPAPVPGPVAEDPRSPFVAAAPSGWHFTQATKGRDGASCEARGGKIVPDTSKKRIPTATGFDYPNKCTADR